MNDADIFIKHLTRRDVVEASEPGASGTSDLKGMFYAALCSWLSKQVGKEVTEVTGMDSTSYDSGGCEYCSYTVYATEITYKTASDTYSWGQAYAYEGTFQDMLDQLLEQDV